MRVGATGEGDSAISFLALEDAVGDMKELLLVDALSSLEKGVVLWGRSGCGVVLLLLSWG